MPFPDFATTADDFNRADENPLSGSGRWTTFTGAGLGGGGKVVSNTLQSSLGAGIFWGNLWPQEFAYSECFIKLTTFGASSEIDLKLRLRDSVTGRYEAVGDPNQNGYMFNLSSSLNARIYRIDAGATTVLSGPTSAAALSAGDYIGFRAYSGVLEGYLRLAGVWQSTPLITASDKTYESGAPGIVAEGNGWVLDDWGVGGPSFAAISNPRTANFPRPALRRRYA